MTRTWTVEEIRALGVRTDVETAGSIYGLGRTKSFELARNGEFPTKVLRLGAKYVVPVAPILRDLGVDAEHSDGEAATASPSASTTNPLQEPRRDQRARSDRPASNIRPMRSV